MAGFPCSDRSENHTNRKICFFPVDIDTQNFFQLLLCSEIGPFEVRNVVQTGISRFSLVNQYIIVYSHVLIYYRKPGNPSLNQVPSFKWIYLRAQEELEKVLGIYIDRKKAALSIGEVS